MKLRYYLPLALVIFSSSALAAITVSIKTDANNISLPGAVVWAIPKDKQLMSQKKSTVKDMEQVNRQFKPFIQVSQRTNSIRFPNRDETAHHVYSFAKGNNFELPLYKKAVPEPIAFNTAGVIPVGCNIHDWMIGYILVVDTPFYEQFTNETLTLEALPHGEYDIHLWHPALSKKDSLKQTLNYSGDADINFRLKHKVRNIEQPLAPEQGIDEDQDY